ncbi:hypothetical protein GCM10009765_72970 [Fodinicola feengrottensis]|uniref:Uncharacterized protein n=1 Tax=Fodinicola feengrottensis TaxID=435914 RepID=A0ABP4UWD8_9ACTN
MEALPESALTFLTMELWTDRILLRAALEPTAARDLPLLTVFDDLDTAYRLSAGQVGGSGSEEIVEWNLRPGIAAGRAG